MEDNIDHSALFAHNTPKLYKPNVINTVEHILTFRGKATAMTNINCKIIFEKVQGNLTLITAE